MGEGFVESRVDFLNNVMEVAVAIELEVAAIYDTFAEAFFVDEELSLFWRLYAETERYHAATIRIHQAAFVRPDLIASAIDEDLPTDFGEMRQFLEKLREMQQGFREVKPSIMQAFDAAQFMENDAAEIHGRTQFFKVYPQFQHLFLTLVEEDLGHRKMLVEARDRFVAGAPS